MKSIDKKHVKDMLIRAWDTLKSQRIDEAVKLSQTLNQQYPDLSEGWYFTAKVALVLHNNKAAEQALKNAYKLAPNNINVMIVLANFYMNNQQFRQAKELVSDLHESTFNAVEHNQLALLFSKLHLVEQSICHYRKAIALDTENHEHYYSLATVLRHAGELLLAEENLNKAIELQPLDIDAHVLNVDLKKQTQDDNSIDRLTQLLEQNLSPKDRVQVYFALAKSYEDLTKYTLSFEQVSLGNKLRREHINYDVKTDQGTISQITTVFNNTWWNNEQSNISGSCPNDKLITPIFVLGMPRTGSTLTDRILSSSNDVFTAGELNDFAIQLTTQVNQQSSSSSKSSFITAASVVDFKKLGSDYLSSVSARFEQVGLGVKSHYFTDKLPFNYLYIGLIKKALPQAKIVHIKRHPLDTCYAIYKTLFSQAYPYSYDLVELAKYYTAYQKLMEHWLSLSGINIHQVNYENLVASPIETGEKLYQYCGLKWQNDFVLSSSHQGNVNTASASQVRQAIHQHSVQKWRHYEKQLGPLKAQLEQAGICCD